MCTKGVKSMVRPDRIWTSRRMKWLKEGMKLFSLSSLVDVSFPSASSFFLSFLTVSFCLDHLVHGTRNEGVVEHTLLVHWLHCPLSIISASLLLCYTFPIDVHFLLSPDSSSLFSILHYRCLGYVNLSIFQSSASRAFN